MEQAKANKKISAMKYLHEKVLYNLVFPSLLALLCRVLCSYSFGVDSLSVFLNPKCFFIVFNVIVVFLVGESRLLGSRRPSQANDLYSEYVEKTRSLRKGHSRSSVLGEAKEEETSEVNNDGYEDKEIVLCEREEEKLVEEELEQEEDAGGELEDRSDDSDELNRRVEDFIAKINKQRWAEARMLICGQA